MKNVQHEVYFDRLVLATDCLFGVVLLDVFPDNEALKERWQADCYLWSLNVEKPMRGQGLGTQLIKDAIAEAKARGCKTMSLEWALPTPRWVLQWYDRLGFSEVEFDEKSALMVKTL